MKKAPILLLLLAASGGSRWAWADWMFDFQNGEGGYSIGSWDWQQTSFFADQGNFAVWNRAVTESLHKIGMQGPCDTSPAACQFTVYTHALLTYVTDIDGNPFRPTGFGTNYEITLTMSFTETVIGISGTPGTTGTYADLAVDTSKAAFVEVFFDTSRDSDPLTGSGFDDGILIARSSLVSSSDGRFTVVNQAPQQMDRFPGYNATADNYGDGSRRTGFSQMSVTGHGDQGMLTYHNLTTDPRFFLDVGGLLSISFQNISLDTYTAANPSDCFTPTLSLVAVGGSVASGAGRCDTIHTDTLYSGQYHVPGRGILPVIGNVNGATYDGTNPDFVAQTDFNNSFDVAPYPDEPTTPVPAPSALMLLGEGLLVVGIAAAIRRRSGVTPSACT